jgi:class 3 adenylate cyclase
MPRRRGVPRRRQLTIIERYSGRVDKLLGDAVMSMFGDPVAHEDDAERPRPVSGSPDRTIRVSPDVA